MKEADLVTLQKWFIDYTSSFENNDILIRKNIDMKIFHTKKVFEISEKIVRKESVNLNHLLIAQCCGLFHDIGRFEQYTKYQTFSDNTSVDHAQLGVDILKKQNVLSMLEDYEKEYIYQAVSHHNKKNIPTQLDSDSLFFIRLTRDADKIDIFRLVTEYYLNPDDNKSLVLELPNNDSYNKENIKNLMEHKLADKKYMITVNDFKLLQLSWVFDLNFNLSFEMVLENKYIDILFNTLPKTNEIESLKPVIYGFIESKIKNNSKI